MLLLREVTKRCWQTAESHGFHTEQPINHDRRLMLMVRELSEAHEELRDSTGGPTDLLHVRLNPDGKPEGYTIELVDSVIRHFDYLEQIGAEIERLMELKMNYNEGRPYLHGRKF